MDIALPGMDGVEAFRAIRERKHLSHIPVVVLTASAMAMDRETFLSYGFDRFISKPIIEEEFMKTIEGVLYEKR
jgi:CheY-like chemotaxis protein